MVGGSVVGGSVVGGSVVGGCVVGGCVVGDPPSVVPVVPVPGLVVTVLPGLEVPGLPIGTTLPSTTVEPGGRSTSTSSPEGLMMRALTGAGRMISPDMANDTAIAGWLGGIVVETPFPSAAARRADGAASSTGSPPWFTHVKPMATAKINAARRVSPTER